MELFKRLLEKFVTFIDYIKVLKLGPTFELSIVGQVG
jgi:hypothetical protein